MTPQQTKQMKNDVQDFVKGKKKLVFVKRWVTTSSDELTRERIANEICREIKKYLLPQP